MDITVKPNQSLADVILNACGSMEAGMQMMAFNNSSISDEPVVGNNYGISDTAMTFSDKGNLYYFTQNEIIVGTKGDAPPAPPPLGMIIALKPVMHAVPLSSVPPPTLGYYTYEFGYDTGFINIHPLISTYLSDNEILYCTQAQWLSGFAPNTTTPTAITPMPLRQLQYHLPWPGVLGTMMQFSNTSLPIRTVTFKDSNGNQASIAPLIIFDTSSQNVLEYFIADLNVELISSTGTAATLRLTRSHATSVSPTLHTPYGHLEMFWLDAATGGTPDPADPANSNKTIVTLGPGSHSMGVLTRYVNDVLHLDFPKSAFTMAIEIF